MQRLVATPLLIAFALVLSGCLAEPEAQSVASTSDSAAASTTASTNGTADPSPTNSSAPANNTLPTANLTSDVANGSAPLDVTFSLEGADDDGDALNWTLDIDADGNAEYNGTELPTEVLHEYVEAGNYTAVLNVTDGTGFAEANITITVEAGGMEPREDDWVRWDELGVCHAKDAIEIPVTGLYIHERGDPPGTGYVMGDGTWIYEESNGIDGLQVGGAGETAAYVDCVTPDTLIF